MKKIITATVLACTSPVVLADATPLFSLYAGAGIWQAGFNGSVGSSTTDLTELGIADEENGNNYFYVALEHAIPVLPNFRLEATSIEVSGTGTLDANLNLGDSVLPAATNVTSDIAFDFTDLTMYYEITAFDIGLTLRQINADILVENTSDTEETITEEASIVLPMLYGQGRFSVPGMGLFFTGSANFISIEENTVTDYRAAIGWEKELSFIARLSAELGYRSFNVELGENEDWSADIETSGPYFGLDVKF